MNYGGNWYIYLIIFTFFEDCGEILKCRFDRKLRDCFLCAFLSKVPTKSLKLAEICVILTFQSVLGVKTRRQHPGIQKFQVSFKLIF